MPVPNKTSKHIEAARKNVTDAAALELTIQHLEAAGDITEQQSNLLRNSLVTELDDARYILKNLGAHLGIGFVFAFDLIPLPLGTLGRIGWVAGARIVETLRRNNQRAAIHSLSVFLIAAIPWFGYAAYLLPLRRQSKELTFLIANHTWLNRTGSSYERYLDTAPALIKRSARWLVPIPWLNDDPRQT